MRLPKDMAASAESQNNTSTLSNLDMRSLSFDQIIVSGQDALSFLQGQFTCDLTALVPPPGYEHLTGQGLGGICNIKGRLVALCWIQPHIDGFSLQLPQSLTEKVLKHLQRFILRSKVSLKLEPASTDELVHFPAFPIIPWITSVTSECFVPQMLNLDCLNAISFTKGCYAGQEIIARTHYLGRNKRRMALFQYQNITEFKHNLIYQTPELEEKPELEVGRIILYDQTYILAMIILNHATLPVYTQGKALLYQSLPYEVTELVQWEQSQ